MCVDDGSRAAAKDVADWIRRGATILRLPQDEASAMLRRWKRPDSADAYDATDGQAELLGRGE